jgi:hypothetical protein
MFIGKVHIIEWLRDNGRRTGWELFGEVVRWASFRILVSMRPSIESQHAVQPQPTP